MCPNHINNSISFALIQFFVDAYPNHIKSDWYVHDIINRIALNYYNTWLCEWHLISLIILESFNRLIFGCFWPFIICITSGWEILSTESESELGWKESQKCLLCLNDPWYHLVVPARQVAREGGMLEFGRLREEHKCSKWGESTYAPPRTLLYLIHSNPFLLGYGSAVTDHAWPTSQLSQMRCPM